MKINKFFGFCLTLAIMSFLGCSSSANNAQGIDVYEYESVRTVTVREPGAVEFIYEPPMVDVVNVPPGLDPEGHYYRPAHQEVVEIRQGRWRYKEAQDIERKKGQ